MASRTIASYKCYLDIPPTSTLLSGRTAQIVLYDANNDYAGIINFMKTSPLQATTQASGYRSTFSTGPTSEILSICCAMRRRSTCWIATSLERHRQSQSGKGNLSQLERVRPFAR